MCLHEKIVKFAITYQEIRVLRSKAGKGVKNRHTYPDGGQEENNQNKSQTVYDRYAEAGRQKQKLKGDAKLAGN